MTVLQAYLLSPVTCTVFSSHFVCQAVNKLPTQKGATTLQSDSTNHHGVLL